MASNENQCNESAKQDGVFVFLRAEYRTQCVGLGESTPRLSWTIDGQLPGWRQQAYQLRLHRADEAIETTLRVESTASTFVTWPFAALRSRERVTVHLSIWGSDGRCIESQPLVVEAGLLDAGDWSARFITPDWDEDDSVDPPASLFRKSFDVRNGLVKARLYSTALGVYEAHINGEAVSDEVLAPGWTSYKHRLRYQTADVTALIASGTNVLSARVADGWFHGRVGFMGGRRHRYGDRLALQAQLELEYADGSVDRVVTGPDAGWQCAHGGLRSTSIYDGESHDARLEPSGWMSPGFEAMSWAGVRHVDWDLRTLVAPDGPPVRRTQLIEPVSISRSPSGKLIVDFGQNLVGWLRIRVRGRRGRVITLKHAEVLEDGELCTRPLRLAKATDQYTLGGDGLEVWEPRFTFHGFRYAQVDGWPGELKPADIAAVVVHSDLMRTGWFECSNAEVTRLHENVVWGMRGNFVDVPTDCPQRDERLGWTGDLQVFAPTATYLFDVGGFLSSWLKDLAAEQAEAGLMPNVVPDAIPIRMTLGGWGDAATVVPWVLYERTGDLGVLQRQFTSMKAWVDQVVERSGPEGLCEFGTQLGDWLDPTAPHDNASHGRTDRYMVASAYLVRGLRIVADASRLLERDDDVGRYDDLWRHTRDAFRRRYVTPGGRVMSDSPTAYAMALRFGLLEDDERANAGDRLNELVARDGYRIGSGFLGTPLICDALTDAGHVETAYKLLLQTESPSWLYTVRMGATTIWERWDSLLPDGKVNPSEMTSFNHYAFGAIADWLHRCVAGLEPAAPGYAKLRIRPRPGAGITWARARHLTAFGEAQVHWRLADGLLEVEAVVPPNTCAEVHLPGEPVATVGAGKHAWSVPYAVPASGAECSVDSPLAELRSDPALWTRVASAVQRVDPGIAMMLDSPALAVIRARSLRDVLVLSRQYSALVKSVAEELASS